MRRQILFSVLSFTLVLSATPGASAEERGAAAKPKAAIAGDLSPYAPTILDRAGWKAKPALPGMKRQEPVAIVLHHTGVRQKPGVALDTKLRGLQSYSQRQAQVTPTRTKPPWPDVPYHYYVDQAGLVAEGREARYAGDTNTGYDTTNYIQLVVEGEFDEETPSPEQMSAVRKTLVWLMLAWKIAPEKISIHKDHAPTTCPGQNFVAMLPQLLAQVAVDREKAISDVCAGKPSIQFSSNYCKAK